MQQLQLLLKLFLLMINFVHNQLALAIGLTIFTEQKFQLF